MTKSDARQIQDHLNRARVARSTAATATAAGIPDDVLIFSVIAAEHEAAAERIQRECAGRA